MSVTSCDYITVVTMDVPTGKLYEVKDGKVVKTPAANNAQGWGVTHYVPDVDTMARLIEEEVSEGIEKAIILGYIRGTEDGQPYRLMSVKKFEAFAQQNGITVDKFNSKFIEHEGVKYATRTKRMYHASTWVGFDRDTVEGMPDELMPNATPEEWWVQMQTFFPELNSVDYLMISSSSSRVHYNDTAIAVANAHVYMKIEQAMDSERMGKAMLIQSFARGCGFMRPVLSHATGIPIGNRPWTLFDPTTFSRERLFFDGKPIVNPKSLEVMLSQLVVKPTVPHVVHGTKRAMDSRAIETPSREEQKRLDIQIEVNRGGRVMATNVRDLTPDVVITVKHDDGGISDLTMKEFVDGDEDRVRCQTPFRPDSESWAGYLSKEDGCHPFMHDVGTHVNYQYNDVRESFATAMDTGIIATIDTVPAPTGEPTYQPNPAPPVSEPDTAAPAPSPPQQIDHSSTAPPPPQSIDPNSLPFADVAPPPPILLDADVKDLPAVVMNDVNDVSREIADAGKKVEFVIGEVGRINPELLETDLGNAELFANSYQHVMRYIPFMKQWFKWVGWRWEALAVGTEIAMGQGIARLIGKEGAQRPDDDTYRAWAKKSCSNSSIVNMVRQASVLPQMVVNESEIDNHWYQFGVGNGYIDLRVDEDGIINGYQEPNRDVFITKSTNIPYVDGADCPKWKNALWEIFSHERDMCEYFQRLSGYTMMGKPDEEITAFLVGEGSNGKSTVINILEAVFSEYKSTVNKSMLMSKNSTTGEAATPALARLKGVRMAVVSESKEGDVLDESVIKSLSGSDTVTARHLNAAPFDFKPMFVTWFPTNHPPIIKTEDYGTWRRVEQIPFNRNFKEELGEENLNKDLANEIKANELSGVLNWLIEGAAKYQAMGLKSPSKVKAATHRYRDSMDILADWLGDCCELGAEYEVTNKAVWESYERHQSATGDQIIKSGRVLSKKLVAKGFESVPHVKGDNGSRGFRGLRIKFGS